MKVIEAVLKGVVKQADLNRDGKVGDEEAIKAITEAGINIVAVATGGIEDTKEGMKIVKNAITIIAMLNTLAKNMKEVEGE
jgi:hypothetical protein